MGSMRHIPARRALPGDRRRARPVGVPVLLGALAVVLGLVGGGSLALLAASGVLQAGTLSAGDLRLDLGDTTWRQVTPGVQDGASGSLADPSDGFVSMPGDVVELRVPVTALLKGDNLRADLVVTYPAPDPGGTPLSAVFHVEDAAGTPVAPSSGETPAGESLTVPGLVGSAAGSTSTWTVVITVTVGGEVRWVTPDAPDPGVSWNAGTVQASLEQVRPSASGGGA